MVTPWFCCGMECGVGSTGTGETGWHWDAGSGSVSFPTTIARSGLRSLRLNPTSSSSWITNAVLYFGQGNLFIAKIYIYIAAHPVADSEIVGFGNSTSDWAGIGYKSSDGTYRALSVSAGGTYTFSTIGTKLITGQWYGLLLRVDASANPWVISTTVDGFGDATVASFTALTNLTGLRLGDRSATSTYDLYFDDLLVSKTNADYGSLGDGYVLSYIPNADGTHNVAGANDFEFSLTGTDITNATTTAFTLIDDRPLPSTAVDFINGIAPPNATDYVEWQYEDSIEVIPPRAVEAVIMYHSAGGAGTFSISVTLRDPTGGTTADIMNINGSGAGMSQARSIFLTIPGTANAWTTAAFNTLRSRFLVSDASPDPYIDAVMLETYYEGVRYYDYDRPGGIRSANQFRQLLAQ